MASTATEGMASFAPLPKHKRYSSTNSFSSSVVTVRRPASVSSSSAGAQTTVGPARSRSPGDTSVIALRLEQELDAQDQKRRRSVAVDAGDRTRRETKDYWRPYSQATTSSAASSGNTRSRASSNAGFSGYGNQAYSPQKRYRNTVDYSPRASALAKSSSPSRSQGRHSPTASSERERRRRSQPAAEPVPTPAPELPPGLATGGAEENSMFSSIAGKPTQYDYSANVADHSADAVLSQRRQDQSRDHEHISKHDVSSHGTSDAVKTYPSGDEDAASRDRLQTRHEGSDARDDSGKHRSSKSKEHSRHKRPRTREKTERDKKFMLAQALAKANTAVLLDNAQNFEGALEAYADACDLLQQVMDRSSGADDKRKLDAIKFTYTNRIEELHQLQAAIPHANAAEEAPAEMSGDENMRMSASAVSPTRGNDAKLAQVTANAVPGAVHNSLSSTVDIDSDYDSYGTNELSNKYLGSTSGLATNGAEQASHAVETDSLQNGLTRSFSHPYPVETPLQEVEPVARGQTKSSQLSAGLRDLDLTPPDTSIFVPAPLSPRRLPLLETQANADAESGAQREVAGDATAIPDLNLHGSTPSASWLDTVDEAASSCGSSVHSVSSQQGLRRKHLRGASIGSNQDLDTAFDTAMEAALDEGMVPDWEARQGRETAYGERNAHHSIGVAEIQPDTSFSSGSLFGAQMSAEDEEEERILDEITHDFGQDFSFDMSTKSALPRQSDSSGYSRSTWQSSQMSDRTTAGTSLSTVAEDSSGAPGSKYAFAGPASLVSVLTDIPPPLNAPPPQTSLPKPPSTSQNRITGVRNRRLSGQNLKQLKIETAVQEDARVRSGYFQNIEAHAKGDVALVSAFDRDVQFSPLRSPLTSSNSQHENLLKSPPSLDLQSAVSDSSRPLTATTATTEHRQSFEEEPSGLRKKQRATNVKGSKSSASLREYTTLLPTPPVDSGHSAMTPMSSTFKPFAMRRKTETSLSAQRATLPSFGPTAADSAFSGGAFLFDTSLSTSVRPTSPRSQPGVPQALEPCPESFLLRPFWLMRNIALTLTHPKGAFITTQLFVPREIWQTKGVKLKFIDDKCAGCDLLTAALGQLAKVDTYDADAAMEELQRFEETMEHVQAAFSKKFGNDVGPSGLASIFKDASANALPSARTFSNTSDPAGAAEKTKSKESKTGSGGYLSSWRKLRNKSSTGAHALQMRKTSDHSRSGATDRESLGMPSVPMTTFIPVEPRSRGNHHQNKNAAGGATGGTKPLAFEGPYREYMSSLARLFDAVSILDQIARQVEDPGLRGTSTTHVGLELSMRHAAEFFAFYVCRFVLADVGVLVDKFVKRGSEWVLA